MHIAATATYHSPGVSPGAVAIGNNHIAATATYHQPAVSPGIVAIGNQHIAATAQYHEHTIDVSGVIGNDHIDATATYHEPAIQPGAVTVAANHISASAAYHQHAVAATYTIAANHIDAAATYHQPAVIPGEVVIGNQHIASGFAIHTPGVLFGQSIGNQHIAATFTLYAPAVTAGAVTIGNQHISATATYHSPAVLVGAATIGMQHIGSTATYYTVAIKTGLKTTTILVATRRRPPRPLLTLYPPLATLNAGEPLDQISIDPVAAALTTFSRIPGGFAELTANILDMLPRIDGATYSPHLPVDNRFRHFGHVELTDGDLTLFEGRMAQWRYVAGEVAWLRAMGYGYSALRDSEYDSASTTGVSSGTIIREALATAAPLIRPAAGTLFIDPQVEHEPVEYDGLMPADILDQISREGDDSGNLVDWAVWENRRIHLMPRVAPSQPTYALAAGDRRIVAMEREGSDLYGQVRVAYKDSNNDDQVTSWIENPRFVDTYGLSRRRTVAAGQMSATAAERFAQAYLRAYSVPRVAVTIETSQEDYLPGPYGEPVPAYLARAGEWWMVGDDVLIALEVQQDWGGKRTRVQLGDDSDTYETWLAWMQRDLDARRAGLNPLGGRSR